jgi:predicted RNA binding protein YcfA (HicA-like mRNA interferase family)
MRKMRRLSGRDVLRVLEKFGFKRRGQTDSHFLLQRVTNEGMQQRLLAAFHGHRTVPQGTLLNIYLAACAFISQDELRPYFYSD